MLQYHGQSQKKAAADTAFNQIPETLGIVFCTVFPNESVADQNEQKERKRAYEGSCGVEGE